jgi:hypothetical protein
MVKGRKRKAGLREPGGRPQRSDAGSGPSRLMVLRAAASNAALGDQAGQAWLQKFITPQEYEQAKRLAGIIAAYRQAIGAAPVRSPDYEGRAKAAQADPDSIAGAEEAAREARAVERYQKIKDRLMRRRNDVWEATRDFCTDVYCDWYRRELAKTGLGVLVEDARERRGG